MVNGSGVVDIQAAAVDGDGDANNISHFMCISSYYNYDLVVLKRDSDLLSPYARINISAAIGSSAPIAAIAYSDGLLYVSTQISVVPMYLLKLNFETETAQLIGTINSAQYGFNPGIANLFGAIILPNEKTIYDHLTSSSGQAIFRSSYRTFVPTASETLGNII
ncbi:MAG: hypothetical protein CUN55_17395, partial [Phototrophicales bacterium]